MRACSSGGRVAYRGKGSIFGAALGRLAYQLGSAQTLEMLYRFLPLNAVRYLLQHVIYFFPSSQEDQYITGRFLQVNNTTISMSKIEWAIMTYPHVDVEHRLHRCLAVVRHRFFQIAYFDGEHSPF